MSEDEKHEPAEEPAAAPADEAADSVATGEPDAAAEPDKAASDAAGEAEAPEEAEVELFRPGMNWYVLRVASNKEDQVRVALERKVAIEKLEERVGRILVPSLKEKRMRGGTARVVKTKLYPGYVFVEMATEEDGSIPDDVWFIIKETTGVGDFIGSGGKPSPMKKHDVEQMLQVAIKREETPTLTNVGFKEGDKVKVREGPFENFEGIVDEINAQKGTARVIVTIFGRATPIEIEYWQVEQL
jgi:transcriptional antiterminator NusG